MERPPLDADVAELRDCYAPAMHWADAFWSACLNKYAFASHPNAQLMQRPLAGLIEKQCPPQRMLICA